MKTLLAIVSVLGCVFGSEAKSADLSLNSLYQGDWLKLDEMYVEYRKFETYKNPYMPDQKDWQFTGEFHNKMSAFNLVYWDTNLHLSAANDRIRYVGLEYELGAHVLPWLDTFKYHHSQHMLEETTEIHFPLEDSYGFRVYFKR